MVLVKKSKCLLSPRYVDRWCCMYKNRLCRLLKRHFNKFAFLQRGSLMILLKNSKYLSSLNFCKRDLGFAVWCFCFHKRRLFNPRTYMQIHTRSIRGVDGPLPPEFLICCSISKRFYLQWIAFDLLDKMRYIIWVVALLGTCDVTNNNRHLGFYQESSGAEVLSSKRKLRKTLRGCGLPPPPQPTPSCPSEGKMIKMPFQLSNWHFSKWFWSNIKKLFRAYFSVKNTRHCRLMMLFSQKEGF